MPEFTTSDGLSIHYTDEGHGLPLLCLAGLTRDGATSIISRRISIRPKCG